ncbi:MAG: hypothetical protein OXN17_01010 [Candidatus Poribacteria bacterium]|nr:hypothetical protein [Candidatus Poribacteria bacterium]MDE0505220.1 hypothetical protein [Candidatus Poribacteria bacterium]
MTHIQVIRSSSNVQLPENDGFTRHLETCPKCAAEYEEMLRTVSLLENLPDPAPPPDLADRIQRRIAKEENFNRPAFFANPFVRVLRALKLNPHPTLVNCTAMVFYLMLTVFLVKLTFFSESDNSRRVSSPTSSVWRSAHVVTTSWAEIRGIPTPIEDTESTMPVEVLIQER